MEILSRFLRWRERQLLAPGVSSLGEQVASNIEMFISVRGRHSLLNTQTAIVMRNNFETFVTADVLKTENRESVAAVVYLKDMECYEQVKTIQADELLRGSTLGPMVLNHLAVQAARDLLKQASEAGHQAVFKETTKQSMRRKNV
jgi:hypothetical protein